FTLRKKIGHVLLWLNDWKEMIQDQRLAEPQPGMCSNPERFEQIRDLPETPIELIWLLLAQLEYRFTPDSQIFDDTIDLIRNSPSPRIRLFVILLEIKWSFRRLNFDHMPVLLESYEKEFLQSKELNEKGSEVFQPAISTSINKQEFHQFEENRAEHLMNALVAITVSSGLKPDIFNAWRINASDLVLSKEFIVAIDLAEEILSQSANDAVKILMSGSETRIRRLLASLRVALDESSKPEKLLYAHLMLATELCKGFFSMELANHVASLVERGWLTKIKLPAMLKSPRTTVPDIESACHCESEGFQKAAKILLAASKAVYLSLPEDITLKLHRLAKQ
ncbi:MAG: hypothetical protein ABIG43_01230, partial [Chloroflexota bacterium]